MKKIVCCLFGMCFAVCLLASCDNARGETPSVTTTTTTASATAPSSTTATTTKFPSQYPSSTETTTTTTSTAAVTKPDTSKVNPTVIVGITGNCIIVDAKEHYIHTNDSRYAGYDRFAFDVSGIANVYDYHLGEKVQVVHTGAFVDGDPPRGKLLSISHIGPTTAPPPTGPATALIGHDRAKQIVIADCGGDIAKANFTKIEADMEDRNIVYEIEFTLDGMEYEYELNARTGDILSVEKEPLKTCFDGINPWLTFSSLKDYKEKLLTLTDPSALRWSFVTGGIGDTVAIRDDKDFAMLLEDGYFLLPVFPKSYSVTKTLFSRDGYSEFSLQTQNGNQAVLTYRHNTKPYEKIDGAERSTLTNARGVTITREYRTDEHPYVYTWNEGGYACRLSCAENADAFLKELSFQKVTIK